jgi:hypothetical protein
MYEDIAGEEKQETSLTSKTIRDNFSITTLKHLANRNVQCHPRSLLRRMIAGEKSSPGRRRKRDIPTKETLELLSFPWFIVEHKRSGYMPEDQRHIQAANAGACAIMMHESLSTIVSKGPQNEHIPPVVTMTTIGPEVWVWIAYSNPPEEGSRKKYVSNPTVFLPWVPPRFWRTSG